MQRKCQLLGGAAMPGTQLSEVCYTSYHSNGPKFTAAMVTKVVTSLESEFNSQWMDASLRKVNVQLKG